MPPMPHHHRSLKSLLASLVLVGLSQPSIAAETVARYEGTGDSYTAEFNAKPPWLLTWRVSSDYPDSVGFELSLVDATSRMLKGRIKKFRGTTASGIRLFNDSGRFRFRVNASFAKWHLQVEELSQEEAAAYTPVQRNKPVLSR